MGGHEILTVNLEGYGRGGLGTLAYDLHELLLTENISSVLLAAGNPRQLPDVIIVKENDYGPVPKLVRRNASRYRLILGRNELAFLSQYLEDLILITGGTAYLQDWLEAHPQKTPLDFLGMRQLPKARETDRLKRERVALERATKIVSAPGLNSRILRKAYPGLAHKVYEVPQVFRSVQSDRPWASRGIDLIAVAQWKDRGVDRDVKGYRFLSQILQRLKGRGLRIVIVGEVPFHLDGVTHTGWVDHEEALRLVGDAKVFVSPSRNECYSQAIVEALHLGCNVVLSRNVEPHGFCHPSLIARYDETAFSHAIDKALSQWFPTNPTPSPKDSLDFLMSALRA